MCEMLAITRSAPVACVGMHAAECSWQEQVPPAFATAEIPFTAPPGDWFLTYYRHL